MVDNGHAARFLLLIGGMFSLDWRYLVAGSLFGLVVPAVSLTIHHAFEDANQYFEFKSMEGPFSVVPKEGADDMGFPATSFYGGDTVGYVINDCLDPKVKIMATSQLVEVSSGYIVNTTAGEIQIDAVRRACGPHKIFRQIPADLNPGYYEIKRSLVFFPNNWAPSIANFPSVFIKVLKKP